VWRNANLAVEAQAIEFNESSFDFGQVAEESRHDHTFTFVNRSTKPVEVKKVRVSCGCVTTQLATNVVLPGATGKLSAELSTAGLRAPLELRRSVFVEFDGDVKPVLLNIRATIVPPITAKPDRLDLRVNTSAAEYRGEIVIQRGSLPLEDWQRVKLRSRDGRYTLREVATANQQKTFAVAVRHGGVAGPLTPIEAVFAAGHGRGIFIPVRVVPQNDVQIIPPTYVAYVSATDGASVCEATRKVFQLRSAELKGLRVTNVCVDDGRLSHLIRSEIPRGPDAKFLLWLNSLGDHDSDFVSMSLIIDYVDESENVAGQLRLPARIMISGN